MTPTIHWTDTDKEKIRNRALELGADQVSFLALKDYVSPASPDPRRYLANLGSFVLIAYRELRGSYMNQSIMRMETFLTIDHVSQELEYRLGKHLESLYDVDVMQIPQHRPFEVTSETWRRVVGPVSIRHLAVQSGMGVFGRNTLVVHPTWGSMVRYGVLLTSARVASDPPLENFDPCSDCSYPCVDNCPANAIQDGVVKQNRCTKYSQPYDVGNFMRAALKMADMNGEELKDFIRTPHFFNLYMASMRYMFYRCIECTRGCPGGDMRAEYAEDIPIPKNATTLADPTGDGYTIFDQGHWDPTMLDQIEAAMDES
jgi:epoxyqueuosine reductase